jgi:hypothetical protein
MKSEPCQTAHFDAAYRAIGLGQFVQDKRGAEKLRGSGQRNPDET